jgi:holo-[acyl-carrier protein] synthase
VIGIGVDLVEVERMRTTLARTPGVARRLFTDDERAYCERRRDPTERYAARFAAKEAVMKALGVGLGAFGFHDVEVVKARSGDPSVRLSGKAATLAAERGVREWRLTLTHTASLAEAIAVAL